MKICDVPNKIEKIPEEVIDNLQENHKKLLKDITLPTHVCIGEAKRVVGIFDESYKTITELNHLKKVKQSSKSKREKDQQGYIQNNVVHKRNVPNPPQAVLKSMPIEGYQDNKRLNTANNFFRSDLFSKTSIENAKTEYDCHPKQDLDKV